MMTMTRLPADSRDVRGQRVSPSQILEEVCAHPTCEVSGRENLELHELWPRSFLRGQPIEGVKLWDGTIVGNQVYLCKWFHNGHHQTITENKAWIRWFGMAFWWVENGEGFKLSYQPEIIVNDSKPLDTPDEPTPYSTPGKPLEATTKPRRDSFEGGLTKEDWAELEDSGFPVGPHARHPVVVHGGKTFHLHTPKEGEECPTCKRKVPAKKKREPAKNRVSLTFRVPKDSQENGAEVLEDLIVEVEKLLYPENEPRPGYYTLCDGLGLVLVNKEIIL